VTKASKDPNSSYYQNRAKQKSLLRVTGTSLTDIPKAEIMDQEMMRRAS